MEARAKKQKKKGQESGEKAAGQELSFFREYNHA